MPKTITPARQETRLRDSSLLRNPSFANRFLIGAEFEIYFKAGQSRRGQDCYCLEDAEADILALLRREHPGVRWAALLDFREDGSLCADSPREQGIEIILSHCKGWRALGLIGKIMRTLGSSANVRTNVDCGLHFNASFADPSLNSPAMLLSIPEHAPIKAMLARFRRSANEYCMDNGRTSLDIDEALDGETLRSLLHGPGRISSEMRLDKFKRSLEKLSNPAALRRFQALALLRARQHLLGEWEDERPACAPRLGEHKPSKPFQGGKAHYCEFRMMGGANYHRRAIDVASTMQECLASMEAASKATARDKHALAPKQRKREARPMA